MSRRKFAKILTLVITICMLSSGIAPANSSCSAECCAPPQQYASHAEIGTMNAGLLSGCCSDLETPPCPHMLESATDIKIYAISAASAEVDPATAKIGVAVTDTSFIRQTYHHVSGSMGPPIRGLSVPLFLENLSLLI